MSGSHALESTRIAKAAADAGFDLTPEDDGGWMRFRSTAFHASVGLAVEEVAAPSGRRYRLCVSDAAVGQRLCAEFGLAPATQPEPWAIRLDGIAGYGLLHRLLQRTSSIARVLDERGLREYVAATRNPPSVTEAVREVVQRVGQDIFRQSLIDYWGGCCVVTGLDVVELLRASHIKPWAACESDAERLDVFNGLLLAPHLDALFDKGFVTFSDDGLMVCSESLSARQWASLGLVAEGELRRVALTDRHRTYLRWHRARVFQG